MEVGMDIDVCLERNEMGDAELLVNLVAATHVFDGTEWYRWDGMYWNRLFDGALTMIDDVILFYRMQLDSAKLYNDAGVKLRKRVERLNTLQRRQRVVKLAEAIMTATAQEAVYWDDHRHLLPCSNGIVDLRTGLLLQDTRDRYIRTHCPTAYRGLDVKSPRWDAFLLDVMGGNVDMVKYLQRLVGYSLVGTCEEHIFPVLWGRGRNGKSLFIDTLGKVLRGIAVPVSSSLLLEQTYTRSSSAPSPDILALQGKKLVWANETDEGRRLSTSLVKWICGGDTLTGRPLYGRQEVVFQPTHTMFLITNHVPEVGVGDYAVWSRMHLIPFVISFVDEPKEEWERKRSYAISQGLGIEEQGILTWCVQGALEWQNTGLYPPAQVSKATHNFKLESEGSVKVFLDTMCTFDAGSSISGNNLYDAYTNWCRSQMLPPTSGGGFGKVVKQHYKSKRSNRGISYLDISFRMRGALLPV